MCSGKEKVYWNKKEGQGRPECFWPSAGLFGQDRRHDKAWSALDGFNTFCAPGVYLKLRERPLKRKCTFEIHICLVLEGELLCRRT